MCYMHNVTKKNLPPQKTWCNVPLHPRPAIPGFGAQVNSQTPVGTLQVSPSAANMCACAVLTCKSFLMARAARCMPLLAAIHLHECSPTTCRCCLLHSNITSLLRVKVKVLLELHCGQDKPTKTQLVRFVQSGHQRLAATAMRRVASPGAEGGLSDMTASRALPNVLTLSRSQASLIMAGHVQGAALCMPASA